jgi:hypothetical protein
MESGCDLIEKLKLIIGREAVTARIVLRYDLNRVFYFEKASFLKGCDKALIFPPYQRAGTP